MPFFEVNYKFHAVGQGLFASGDLTNRQGRTFRWVYDCGTSSAPKQQRIDTQLKSFVPECGRRLDMVSLSHFDEDHINGLSRLLQQCHVRMLLLPYIPFFERLEIAFDEQAAAGSARMQFLIDPVRYFVELEDSEIEQIVLVPRPGDDGPPPPETEGGEGPSDDQGDAPWPIDFESVKPDDPDDYSDIYESPRANRRALVNLLHPSTALKVARFWEFLPYNEPSRNPISEDFKNKANLHRNTLLGFSSETEKEQALDELKELYAAEFGSSAGQRNRISLFLYGGPVGSWVNNAQIGWEVYVENSHRVIKPYDYLYSNLTRNSVISLFYTGDGSIHTQRQLDEIRDFLGHERIEQISVFQVMHHGAKKNWRSGVADAFQPCLSIFSSDPTRTKPGHPDAEVLRDFWPYYPLQSDKDHCVFIGYIIHS